MIVDAQCRSIIIILFGCVSTVCMSAHACLCASDQSCELNEDKAMVMLQTSATTLSSKTAKDVAMSSFLVPPTSMRDTNAAGRKVLHSHISSPYHVSSWLRHHASAEHSRVLQDVPMASSTKVIFLNSKYPIDYPETVGPEMVEAKAVWSDPACPVSCTFTKDTSMLTSADAVIWNPRWMNPVPRVPATKPSNQKWVFTFYFEPPVYNSERVGNYTTKRLNGRVDWTMSFDSASDILWPIIRLLPRQHPNMAASRNFAEGKQHLLLWIASNCEGNRFKLMNRLKALLPQGSVHVFGDCGEPVPCPGEDESTSCFKEWFSKYKFYAAFENSLCDGYVSEKFARALGYEMVPVVFGGRSRYDYERIAPADSFLYVEDFPSADELAERLLSTASNDTEYNKFFAWRAQFQAQDGTPPAFCELCQRLHNDSHAVQLHSDLTPAWYDRMCRNSNFSLSAPFHNGTS
mmetsp:Transcript_160437/g.293072  ORF Transcript_160437/g.293072 Transcript_160437/m.293072 type:complete len:461 (-) Transcript_160437:40-1422(-)